MADKEQKDKKTLEEAITYCPGQINNLSFTRGYTPAQWVLGRAPEDTLSLIARFFNPGMSGENEPMSYDDLQGKRLAAQMAYLRADSDARLRRAMNQKYKQLKTCCCGTKVLVLASSGERHSTEEQLERPCPLRCRRMR